MNEIGKRVCQVLELDETRVRSVRVTDVAGEPAKIQVEYRVGKSEVAAILGGDNPTGKPERVPR